MNPQSAYFQGVLQGLALGVISTLVCCLIIHLWQQREYAAWESVNEEEDPDDE